MIMLQTRNTLMQLHLDRISDPFQTLYPLLLLLHPLVADPAEGDSPAAVLEEGEAEVGNYLQIARIALIIRSETN